MTFKNAYRRMEDIEILLIKDGDSYILQPFGTRDRRHTFKTTDLDFIVSTGYAIKADLGQREIKARQILSRLEKLDTQAEM